MTQKTKAHIALLGTNIFFAINYTVVKFLVNNAYIKPFGLNLIRVGVTAILLWIMFIWKPVKAPIQRKHIGRFVLCALTGIAINQLLFLKGLSLTFPIHASLLMLTTPILITIIAAWVLKERMTGYKLTGLALGIGGAVILLTAKETLGNPSEVLLGDIMIILNAISYTLFFVLVKPLMKVYNPVVVIRVIFTIGFVLIFPFCYSEFMEIPWQSYNATAFINLAVVVFCGTFLAYILNVYGIKILGASIAGTYIYSQPVFAAAIAIVFLGESLTWYKIIAAVFIFAGVYLSNKSNKHA